LTSTAHFLWIQDEISPKRSLIVLRTTKAVVLALISRIFCGSIPVLKKYTLSSSRSVSLFHYFDIQWREPKERVLRKEVDYLDLALRVNGGDLKVPLHESLVENNPPKKVQANVYQVRPIINCSYLEYSICFIPHRDETDI
jgi:hypothetical protein